MKKSDTYEIVTNAIIEGLKSGNVAWKRPWSVIRPCNPSSGTKYSGLNLLLLSMSTFADPRWMTCNQINKMGGRIKKGEKGTPIVFWKQVSYEDDKTGKAGSYPVLKQFYVFNVEQTEGLDLPPIEELKDNQRIERCEEVVQEMPLVPEIRHGGNRACYSPYGDWVQMPIIESFAKSEAYYATLFHELGHATGHESRLARPEVMQISTLDKEGYSREELVAELTAAFLCQEIGIDNDTENTQAYIQGWLKVLNNDPKMVVQAAGLAGKAANFIMGRGSKAKSLEEKKELATV
jgi:antirestriction protein ArdC